MLSRAFSREVQVRRDASTSSLVNYYDDPVESSSSVNRKRKAVSVASASGASTSKRFRRSSSEVLEDARALGRLMQENLGKIGSPGLLAPTLQEKRNSRTKSMEQLRAEVSDLRRQQAIDRAHFEFALDTHNDQLKDIRRALDGRRRGRTPTGDLASESESEDSTVKSEHEMELDIYEIAPELRENAEIGTHAPFAEPAHAAGFEEDLSLPTVTEVAIKLYDGMQMPALFESLPPLQDLQLPERQSESFQFDFLKKFLGGKAVSSGWWVIPPKTRNPRLFPHLKSYRALNSDYDPLLPRCPGDHGVQLSCMLAELDDEHLAFPLFIRRGQEGYKYYGTYREPRYSDRLGGNEMAQVPKYVKEHWASQIGAQPMDGKIPKHNETIRAAWPKVPVGWLTEDYKSLIPYQEHLEDEFGEKPLTRPITEDEADEVGETEILEAFEIADTDTAPSMRLFYEYLQCVGYDHEFYEKLVSKKLELEL